jgi:anti-sigma factor RsiW
MKKIEPKANSLGNSYLVCMGVQNMRRRFDKHIDDQELNALVPSSSESGQELGRPSPGAVREAERHVESCVDCRRKVSKYRQLVNRSSNVISEAAPPGADCPRDQDVDWQEVAAGLWPELKARQLIMHAALCDHCGPLLRAATSVDDDPTPQEEELLAELKAPSRPDPIPTPVAPSPSPRRFMWWLVPAVALMMLVGMLGTRPSSSPRPLSGPKFAEFAVSTHRQHAQGRLALDVHSDSQQALNEWFKEKSQFSVALPASPAAPGEERPYRLEGARLVQVGGKTAAFIAYHLQTSKSEMVPASLIVTPDAVAVASGGTEVDFKKVRFHYAMVEGYRVVTWSLHGLTYALVSQEENGAQRSCMVCHSAMRDRDLSQTPTPLHAERNTAEPILQ